MHREIIGTGNQYMDRFEHEVKKMVHKKRVTIARNRGNSEFSATIFDPDVFVLGTSHMESFPTVHRRNQAKTLQLKEERCSEIERENKILFEKMALVQNRELNIRTLQTGQDQ